MIRITGGLFKGRKLAVPRGRKVRPTTDRVRETIFAIIGDEVRDASVLDLFAGTGALGLEALSRGARDVVFVERDRQVCTLLTQNIRACGVEAVTEIFCCDWVLAVKKLTRREHKFKIIFADPPYESGVLSALLDSLADLAFQGSLAVLEHAPKNVLQFDEDKWDLVRVREFGHTAVSFFERL